jgi:hypothetical protein
MKTAAMRLLIKRLISRIRADLPGAVLAGLDFSDDTAIGRIGGDSLACGI